MPEHIIAELGKISPSQVEKLKKCSVMIGTPMREGTAQGNYLLSLNRVAQWAGILGLDVRQNMLFGSSYIQLGRNYIANAFMQSDCTHLFFIDADNGFVVNHFFEVLLADKPICGAAYPKRAYNWKAVHQAVLAGVPPELLSHCSGDFPMHPLEGHDITLGHEPQKVLTLPTGFLCIQREVFEKHKKCFPDRETTPGHPGHFGHEYFFAGVTDGIDKDGKKVRGWDTEDNNFCKEMLTLGVNTYFCPWVNVTHFGPEMHDACYPCSLGYYEVHMNLKPKKKLELVK